MNTQLTIGQEVQVTFAMRGKSNWVFTSEVVDIATTGVWVDHPELRGEDMLFIEIDENLDNKVEAIVEEVAVKREHSKGTDMKEAKKVLQKAFKWEEEEIKVFVKVYDYFEDNSNWEQFDDQQSYDVEISWAIGDEEYTDCVVVDSFYSNVQDDEVSLKDANKRAKSVLKTVKGWFDGDSQVTVTDTVKVYHA